MSKLSEKDLCVLFNNEYIRSLIHDVKLKWFEYVLAH